MAMAKIPFYLIKLNDTPAGKEVVFPYGNSWYKLSWDDVPDRYKELCAVNLKLAGFQVPEWLRDYDVNTVDVSSVDVEIDLDKCIEIPETYPIGA